VNPDERKYLLRVLAAHALEGILAGSPRIDDGTLSACLPSVNVKSAARDAVTYAEQLVLELEAAERL